MLAARAPQAKISKEVPLQSSHQMSDRNLQKYKYKQFDHKNLVLVAIIHCLQNFSETRKKSAVGCTTHAHFDHRTYSNPSESVLKLQQKRVVISLIVTRSDNSTLLNSLSDINGVRKFTNPLDTGGAVRVELPQQQPIITMDAIQISTSLVMPNGVPRHGIFHPTLTLMIYSYRVG